MIITIIPDVAQVLQEDHAVDSLTSLLNAQPQQSHPDINETASSSIPKKVTQTLGVGRCTALLCVIVALVFGEGIHPTVAKQVLSAGALLLLSPRAS